MHFSPIKLSIWNSSAKIWRAPSAHCTEVLGSQSTGAATFSPQWASWEGPQLTQVSSFLTTDQRTRRPQSLSRAKVLKLENLGTFSICSWPREACRTQTLGWAWLLKGHGGSTGKLHAVLVFLIGHWRNHTQLPPENQIATTFSHLLCVYPERAVNSVTP